MKKRIFAMLMATTMIVGLIGCGSSEAVVNTPAETPVEMIVEETSIETEETVVEETTVEEMEAVTETLEETEVVEVEPLTFERENIVMTACMTNLGRGGESYDKYMIGEKDDTYNSNDFLDVEVMTELANRGYNIDDLTITWMVAVNENGESEWAVYGKDTYGKVDDTDNHFAKLYPIFIKTENVNEEKEVYNYFPTDVYNGDSNGNADSWYAIAQATKDMKADENYEEIDFNIPQNTWTEYYQSYIDENYTGDDSVCEGMTINDWYNGMIYAMFVSETVDLNGYFHCINM